MLFCCALLEPILNKILNRPIAPRGLGAPALTPLCHFRFSFSERAGISDSEWKSGVRASSFILLYYRTILFRKTIKVILLSVDNSAKKLGRNIKKIRLTKGMTQGDICRKIEIDRAYMSNIESGNKNPTLSTITNLAKALGVSIDELLK